MIGVVIREEAANDIETIRTVQRLAFDGDEEARLGDGARLTSKGEPSIRTRAAAS
jgi:hypothetical protein